MTTPIASPFRCTFLLTSDLHSALEAEKDKKVYDPIASTDEYPLLKVQAQQKQLTADSEMGGAVRRTNYIAAQRELGRPLLFDAGDFLSGTLWFNAFKGSLDVDIMNLMEYDAMTIGNHDLDLGWNHLKVLLQKVNFTVLCSNIFEIDSESGKRKKEPILAPYKIIEVGGDRKIAVIGIMGKPSWEAIGLDKKSNLEFLIPDEVLPELLKNLPQVDYSILLSHSGIETDRKYAESYPQINAILGGHSHTLMEQHEQIGKTVILHPGPRGRVITKLEVNGDQTHSSVEILDSSWDHKNMTETSKKIDALLRENKPIVEEGFTREVAICLEPISALDKKERNSDLGKLICEMLCSIEKKAHIAFINSGSIRIGELEKGPLTLKDLTNLFTGGDGAVWTVSANGAWVEKIMATAESRWKGESKHIQYGGIVKIAEKKLEIQGEPSEKECLYEVQGEPLEQGRFYDVRAPKFFFQREELPESIFNNEYLEHPETLTQLISAAFSEQKVIKKS